MQSRSVIYSAVVASMMVVSSVVDATELAVASYPMMGVFAFDTATGANTWAATRNDGGVMGVTYGLDGNLYLANTADNILVYDSNTGSYLKQFTGDDAYWFRDPEDIVFGPDGNLYASSQFSDSVWVFDGLTGSVINNQFVHAQDPTGLRFDQQGNLYIAGRAGADLHGVIYKMDSSTGATSIFAGSTADILRSPKGFDFGTNGDLFVSDFEGNKVVRFNGQTGEYVETFIARGVGGLSMPYDLEFGPDGLMYVSEWNYEKVLRYDSVTGAFVDEFASLDSGSITGPTYLAFSPVPIPPALYLFGSGLITLFGLSKRSKSS